MYESIWRILFQVFIPFMLRSIAMKVTIFDNICGEYIKCWRGMDPIWHPRWPPNTNITFTCNFLVPLDISHHIMQDFVPFSNTLSKFLRKYMHFSTTKTKLILCLFWSFYACTGPFWRVLVGYVSTIMNQLASFALFGFFNLSRI